MKYLLLVFCTILYLNSFSQSAINVGDAAPAISITDWIANVPENRSLKDKFVVLEFWATWCGPCIEAVPHMNALQEKFANSKLCFISMTDEPPSLVISTMKRVKFNSIVVSDQQKSTHIRYGDGKKGLERYPLAVLINNKGFIAWIGEPRNLSEQLLKKFLKGEIISESKIDNLKTVKVEPKGDNSVAQNRGIEIMNDISILYRLELRESQSQNYEAMRSGSTSQYFGSVGFQELCSRLSNKSINEIIVPDNIKYKKYDFIYKNQKGTNSELDSLAYRVYKLLGLKRTIQLAITEANEISVSDEKLLEKSVATNFSSISGAGENVIFSSISIESLIKELNFRLDSDRLYLGKIVEGNYNFFINMSSHQSIFNSLESYGLTVKKVERKVEIWTLEF